MIKVNNLTKKYNMGEKEFFALKDESFEAESGEIVTILGPSGSGKSTLLNILGGIDKADNGSVIIDDMDISKLNDNDLTKYRRDKVGFIFQFYNLIPNLTVLENIEVSENISKNAINIKEVLEAVGMYEKKDKFPSELSGGEQQRVSIARAIVKNPSILLCDEPTGALDYNTSKDILNLIEKINKEYKTTIFIVTHNNEISKMADRIIRVRSGEIVENVKNDTKISAKEVEW